MTSYGLDLLARVGPGDVRSEPFPHVVVRSPVPDDAADRLAAALPGLETLSGGARLGSNRRFSYPAVRALADERLDPLWREVISGCTSGPFLARLVEIFAPHVRAAYPDIERALGPLGRLRAGLRFRDDFDRADVLLDALISVNTPVAGRPSSVRRVHVDSPHKLFAGLYYLRAPGDDSAGGDLELCRFRSGPGGFRDAEVADRNVDVVETITYGRNVLVLYMNSIRSLHGVTVRGRTPHPRHFLNLVAEVREPLFDLSAYQAPSLLRAVVPEKARLAARAALDRLI